MKILFSKKLFAFLITVVLFFTTAHAQTTTALDNYILDKMKDHHLPGVSVAIVKDGKLVLVKGYGLADIEKDIPYTPNTIQGVASISKPVTATAIMKLWEQGSFQLDDPINNYLPFPVINPFFPGTPITFRMLLSHTSSVNFGYVLVNGSLKQPYALPGSAPALGSFLQSYFVPGGSLYIDSISYLHFQPGTHYEYSNFGYALLGYLVEVISGMPFNEYCNQNIFQTLCMSNTSWHYSELDTNIVSRVYQLKQGENGQPYDFGLFEWADYPGGQLKSTVIDVSKFMLMHLNYGILNGTRIIDSTTEVMMRNVQIIRAANAAVEHNNQPFYFRWDQCLGLEHVVQTSNNNEEVFGKGGGGPGINSHAWFKPSHNEVISNITNITNYPEQELAAVEINIHLDIVVADTIPTAGHPELTCSYSFNPCEQNADYWKNNISTWPLSSASMKLGTKHYYSKSQSLALLNRADNGDASIVLAKALITAKLNIAQGSELEPIILTYNSTMNLIGTHRLPYDNPVSFSSATGIQMLALAATLDSYNSGSLNTTACPGIPSGTTRSDPASEIGKTATQYSLSVFPNPSSGNTTISFIIPNTEKVSLTIYDMNGRLVKTLIHDTSQKGSHDLTWNTTSVNAGAYILKLQSGSSVLTRKLVVIK